MRAWSDLCASQTLGHTTEGKDRLVLFEKGAPADHAYLLAHGAIEILQPGADGMSVVVKILQAPTLFGAIEAFGEEPLYLETVRCLGKVRVVRMTSARLRQVALDNPRAGYEALLDVARAFCVAARLEPARLAQTDTLLANALLAYVDVVGEERDGARFMTVKRTQSDLAAAIGAGERSVNRILSAWLDAGVVVKRDARYGVVDRAFLENLAGDLLGSLVHGSAHLL